MSDNNELRQERDQNLVYRLLHTADTLRQAYQEWIQQELNNLIPKAEILELTQSGSLRSELQAKIRRMREIDNRELKEAVDNINHKIAELRVVVVTSDDIITERQSLEDCLSRFRDCVRELLDIRRLLVSLSESNTPSLH